MGARPSISILKSRILTIPYYFERRQCGNDHADVIRATTILFSPPSSGVIPSMPRVFEEQLKHTPVPQEGMASMVQLTLLATAHALPGGSGIELALQEVDTRK